MHPLPRTTQQRIIRLIARFTTFVRSPREPQAGYLYNGTEPLDIEIARHVLSDLISNNAAKLQEWGNMLQGLSSALGETWSTSSASSSAESREALITLRLPDSLKGKAQETANGVRDKLLPLLKRQEQAATAKDQMQDIVTRAVLPAGQSTKRCTSCSGRSAIIESQKQGDWELARCLSCICGGSWVAE